MEFNLKFLTLFLFVTAILAGIIFLLKRPWKSRKRKPDLSGPANDLETAIFLAAANPFQLTDVYSLLIRSRLFVMGSISPDRKIALKHWKVDEKPLIPAFTSVERLREAITHEEHYIEIDTVTFLKSIPGDSDVVLNPNSRFALELKHGEIVKVLEETNHQY